MASKLTVLEALQQTAPHADVLIQGWVRTRRDSKAFTFLEVNDGSCLRNLQMVVTQESPAYGALEGIATGAAVSVTGPLVASQGAGQAWEVQAATLICHGRADASYPLQKKGHSVEFLREIAHLRPRTNLFGAVFRLRSRLSWAIHSFFQQRGFVYVHTPIITGLDCEGAGEQFHVTTLDVNRPPRTPEGAVDHAQDFFGKPTHLTVSGQLEVETFCCALSKVYTFGPTFRAENSHTSRHASEFWMIEPEMAFCDLNGDMDLAEAFVQYLVGDALDHAAEDLAFLGKFVDKGLEERLRLIRSRPFERLSYREAVEILQKSGQAFQYPVDETSGLQSEHERYLTEEYCRGPVTVYNYPRAIKPFYMRVNDDRETVAAMDLLVPGIGELIGGSQREERLDVLLDNLRRQGLPEEEYRWYADLRRFGTVPHAGFGLGFERMLMLITGVSNIRDVIPFPRTPGHALP